MTSSISSIKQFKDHTQGQRNRRKSAYYDNLTKRVILLKLYNKQRVLAEGKTILAVESCQKLMLAEIERLFRGKYIEVAKFIDKLSTSVGDMVDCSSLMTPQDIQSMTSILEEILQKQLAKHFRISHRSALELGFHPNQLFNLIEEWHKTMSRSLFITQQVEKWSIQYFHKAIMINFQNEALLHIVKRQRLGIALLKSLGIDAREQKAEFLNEMQNRLEGTLDSIKLRMITKIKEQVAQVFYQLYDNVIDRRFEEKITLLQNGLDDEEKRYSLMRREA